MKNNQKTSCATLTRRALDVWVEVSCTLYMYIKSGEISMATTGELRAIIEELQLVDIGEAASYLGEEIIVEEEANVSAQQTALSCIISVQQTMCTAPLCNCAI